MPLWLPLVLRPATARFGIHYREYRHIGLRAFALRDASFTNKTVTVRAERLELLAPSTWLFRLLTVDATAPYVRAEGWTVEVRKGPLSRPSSPPPSVFTTVLDLQSVLRQLETWIPVAVLSNGVVRVPGFAADVPSGAWSNGVLGARATSSSLPGNATLNVSVTPDDVSRFDLESQTFGVEARGQLSTTSSGLSLQTSGLWLSNRFDLKANFTRTSVLPQTGTLNMPDFHLRAATLGATNYPDVFGSLKAEWREGQLALDLVAGTTFLSRTSPPPVHITIFARGDTNAAVIHSAKLDSHWFTAELSRDFVVHFTGELLDQPGFLRITADLSRQNWLPVTGLVQGEATFSPAGVKFPDILFRVSGANIGLAGITSRDADVAGIFNWPLLNLTALSATFADNSHAEATGIVNLDSKTVTNGHVMVVGPFAKRWLPPGSTYEALTATADVSGSFTNLAHRGLLEVTNFTATGLRPLSAHLDWSGQGLRSYSTTAQVKSRNSSLELEGNIDMQPGQTTVQLKSLALRTNNQPLFQLVAPFSLSVNRVETNTVLSTQPFRLAGPAGEMAADATVAWPTRGTLNAELREIQAGIVSDFLQITVPEISVKRLDLSAGWTNGPVTGHAAVLASGFAPIPHAKTNTQLTTKAKGYPLTVELDLAAETNRLSISNLLVTTRTSTVTTATGILPVTVSPADPRFVRISTNEPVQFSAAVKPEAVVWRELTDRLKVSLNNPNLKVDLAGTWSAPNAQVTFTSDQVHFLEAGPRTPTLNGLSFNATLQPDRARADLHILAQGLPVTAIGEMPLDTNFWSAVNRRQIPSFSNAAARLVIRDSSMALVAGLYPTLLAPQGDIAADISLLPGGQLKGGLSISDARTRPFPSVGPIRDINLTISFLGRSAAQTATARVGGTPVRLDGSFDLAGTQWLQGRLPPFNLTLTGTNVPISRKPESIIRSDINLILSKTNGAPPLIVGAAQMRNSFYLSDVRALLPSGGGSTPSRRPPYFSVEDPFFADWRLGVHVSGDRFLKIRSTLFNGEISGNFELQGTLEDPMAVGDLRIASGWVRFPFGRLNVQQGFVTLSSQDPYRPQLALSATAKQFGYDIRMDVSGPADHPLLQFSSAPPLSSEQIVMMITAGQVPREQQVYSTTQRAQTFALFLGQDLLSQLGLADNAQNRLTVRSGEQLTETGRPTYSIEYELTPRWFITGEYDRFNEYNAGVRWRVYSR